MKQHTSIAFVRHGHVHNPDGVLYGRLPGYKLDEQGVRQAKSAANMLRYRHPAVVFSSPLLRARQTAAEILSFHRHLRLRISRLLNEVHTPYEGRPAKELRAIREDVYSGAAAGYDQPADILRRARKFMDRMRQQYPGRHVVAVSHGDVIAFSILWAAGLPLDPQNRTKLTGAGIKDAYPAHASITTFHFVSQAPEALPAIDYQNPE
jgi:probable phosphoglycerate mutase